MQGTWVGLAAAAVGIIGAWVGWVLERRSRLRRGEPASARAMLTTSPLGVERAARAQAAQLALPAYVLVMAVLAGMALGSAAAGTAMGLAGLFYGSACAIASARLAR